MMMRCLVDAACQCDVTGSTGLQCDTYSGQCPCRANILGRRCDRCDENKYNVAAGCLGLYTTVAYLHQLNQADSVITIMLIMLELLFFCRFSKTDTGFESYTLFICR